MADTCSDPRRAALLAAAVIAAACAAPQEEPPAARPNVVVVVIDTLRADHLGDYGYHRPTDVALAPFVRSATRFDRCTAPTGWTNPSVASILTGLHPVRHGTRTFGAALADEVETVAERLAAEGWHTAAISFNPGVRSELGFDQGFAEFDEFLGRSSAHPPGEEMVRRVATWLQADPSLPFFLYLHPMDVHGPYHVPQEHRAALLGRPPSTEFRYYQEPMKGILRRGELELRAAVTDSYLESLVESYDTAIRYCTDQVARILDLLAARDLLDDALVVITADHGEELFDHGGFSHGYSLHRELTRVPLYFKLPGQRRSAVVDAPVSLMDLSPTILDVATRLPESTTALDGRSLFPFLRGEEPTIRQRRRPMLLDTAWRGRCVARGLLSPRYRLLEIDSSYEGLRGAVRLYDRLEDPAEQVDISGREPELAARLRAHLRRRIERLEASGVSSPDNRADRLDLDRLRALGYVE